MIKERVVDTKLWLNEVRKLVLEGNDIPVLVTGYSMTPFLVHKRDTVVVTKPKEPFRRGDIVFYQRANGQYILHRIVKCKEDQIWCSGDAQCYIEGPFPASYVFGIVKTLQRKEKWIQKGNFWWDFFEGPWVVLYPIRRYLFQLYNLLKKIKSWFTKEKE